MVTEPSEPSAVDLTSATSGQRGASLVELIVGTVLIVTMLGAGLSLTVTNSRLRALDSEVALAFNACRTALEEVRGMDFADIPTLNGRGFPVPGTNGSANGLRAVPGDADGLPGVFTVAVERSSGSEVLYRVRTAVQWQGAGGAHEQALEALVANRGGP